MRRGRNVDGATAYLALEDARLDGDQIEHEIVDGVHADESHLIIDACNAYLLVAKRGPDADEVTREDSSSPRTLPRPVDRAGQDGKVQVLSLWQLQI